MNTTATLASPAAPKPVSPWIWPGLLILGPASVVVACIITAYFVLQHPDALVASDYYKAGKAINAQLSQLDRAKQLIISEVATVRGLNEKAVEDQIERILSEAYSRSVKTSE